MNLHQNPPNPPNHRCTKALEYLRVWSQRVIDETRTKYCKNVYTISLLFCLMNLLRCSCIGISLHHNHHWYRLYFFSILSWEVSNGYHHQIMSNRKVSKLLNQGNKVESSLYGIDSNWNNGPRRILWINSLVSRATNLENEQRHDPMFYDGMEKV